MKAASIIGYTVQLSSLNKRRWINFKNNRRGYFSLWLFSFIFFTTLFAEFIANDKPLLIFYKSEFYTPIFHIYPETTFNGEFELEIDYRQKYARELIEPYGWMLWAPIRYSYDTINYARVAPASPTFDNILGTDDQGRDVMARVIYGFRISVLFGLILTLFSSLTGLGVGAIQGFYGGKIDLFGQRFIDVWSGMPNLYLLIILSSFFEPGFWWLLVIMFLFSWIALVDLARAEFLRGRNLEYVRAARALGMNDIRLMYHHILPNAMIATVTFMPFILTGAITTLTSLDFLGFGLPAGSPSLGELIAQGKNNLQAPWLGITAFLVMSVMLTLLVFIGEATRDALDPQKYHIAQQL